MKPEDTQRATPKPPKEDAISRNIPAASTRLGFMTEKISLPADFDRMAEDEIEQLFAGE